MTNDHFSAYAAAFALPYADTVHGETDDDGGLKMVDVLDRSGQVLFSAPATRGDIKQEEPEASDDGGNGGPIQMTYSTETQTITFHFANLPEGEKPKVGMRLRLPGKEGSRKIRRIVSESSIAIAVETHIRHKTGAPGK